MNILLFGISNVGKTTAGRTIAKKLGYDFYDLDDEVSKHCHMSIEEFISTVWQYERDKIRGEVIRNIIAVDGNKVIAVAPMYYTRWFSKYLKQDDVRAIENNEKTTLENNTLIILPVIHRLTKFRVGRISPVFDIYKRQTLPLLH